MFAPKHEQQPELTKRFAQLHAYALRLRAIEMLLAVPLLADAELVATLRKLQSGELGLQIKPTLHDQSLFRWFIVNTKQELVLELGEGPIP